MKFRCNICAADPDSADYTCTAYTFDDGMLALQSHIDMFHGGGSAVVQDVTLNVKTR